MNLKTTKYMLALAIGVSFADTHGQVLAPNAAILVAKQDAGLSRVKISSQEKKAATDTREAVGAYVYTDTREALDALRQLGAEIRHDYGEFATVTIPVDKLKEAGNVAGVRYITLGNDVTLLNDYSRARLQVDKIHDNTLNRLPAPYTGKGVVVGLIDSGVEYGHLAFRETDGTGLRIKAVWEQSSILGTPPEKFGYGVEHRTPEAILGSIYDTISTYHGSHTMGIAAGGDMTSPYYGIAPEAEIVYVSFNNDDAAITDAIEYIFDYADEVDKPCVINMSLGSHTGPHNGTSVLDKYIDSVTGPGRVIVGAAGNEGEYRLHATETFSETDTQLKSMLTFAKGVSHNYHYLDIWGSAGDDIKVKICVAQSLKGNITYTSPTFDTSDPDLSPVVKATFIDEVGMTASIIIKGEVNPINGQPHVMVECQVEEIADGRVPGIIVEGAPGQQVDIWNYSGHEFSSNGKSGWTEGTLAGTVGEIGGTAHTIIPVGSYDARETIPWTSGGYSVWSENFVYDADNRSVFSSCGPTADGRVSPSVLAPGNPVISAINRYYYQAMGVDLYTMTNGMSTNSEGVHSYYGYNSGTSMSAPMVAGTIALMLEANPGLSPSEIREIIEQTAETDDFMGELPNNEYGAGRLNALECVKLAVARAGICPNEAASSLGEQAIKVWREGTTVFIGLPTGGVRPTARVTNVTGQTIMTAELTDNLTQLDCSGWGNGVFIITVDDGKTAFSRKITI